MLMKVISGGQTGADQAGIMVAKRFGIATGGFIPKGFRTAFGPAPELAEYGLVETTSSNYVPRTRRNVKEADVTIRLASNFASAGEKVTLTACNFFNKPHFDVLLDGNDYAHKAIDLAEFIMRNNYKIINVAGNADFDKVYGKHFYAASEVLTQVFHLMKSQRQIL